MRLKRAIGVICVSTRPCSSGLTTAGQMKKAKTRSAQTTPARGSSLAPLRVSVACRRRTSHANGAGSQGHELRRPSTKPCNIKYIKEFINNKLWVSVHSIQTLKTQFPLLNLSPQHFTSDLRNRSLVEERKSDQNCTVADLYNKMCT